MAKPAFTQIVVGETPTPTPIPLPTPSVPQFTVQPVGPPTFLNTTYSLDQNTGQIVANIGYTNEYSAVNITIKNQFVSNLDGNTVYYNVRIKLDNANDGSNVYNANEPVFPQESDSEYTILIIGLVGSQTTLADIPVAAEVDIQVQGLIGSIGPAPSLGDLPSWYSEFYGNTGPWSSTQTVNVPANVPLSPTPAPSSSTLTLTPTPTPSSLTLTLTPTPTSSYASLLLITTIALVVIAFLLAIIISLLIYMRKRKPINLSQ